jgi:tetratricopeptide (TPR) repeat protein
LSRDVLSLAWTGHQLLAAGKKEAALTAYRSALELAAKAEPKRLGTPAFLDESQVRRYALPGEDLIGPIVRDMAESHEWTYAEWSRALPSFAVAPLAAARVLHELSRPEAAVPLDAILGQVDTPPPAGTPAAVHVAAQAEALALKGRWEEADRRYRQAIDQIPDGAIRRSWWINVAEIAVHLSHEANRQKALEAAKGNDPNEEITRRAVELLKFFGRRNELNRTGSK